jgi:hypothetical protein
MILWLYYIIYMCNLIRFDGDNVLKVEVHDCDIFLKWIDYIHELIITFMHPYMHDEQVF